MANAVSTNGQDDGGGGIGGVRPPRLPRWTRHEILVLIQGKKVAESKGRGRSRVQQMGLGSAAAPLVGVGSPVEPKWATVSSYCRRHGVNRGPVQCRKRWSNLAGDFKKIKEWELRRAEEEGNGGGGGGESFWSMRNDLRRERRLPGFFDRGVYDILDGAVEIGGDNDDSTASATRKEAASAMMQQQQPPAAAAREDEEEEETVFDSGRTAAEDGLFSDFEADDEAGDEERLPPPPQPPVAATPISERKSVSHDPSSSDQAAGKQQGNNLEKPATTPALEANKRRRTEQQHEEPREAALEHRLLDVLERNGRMLSAQLEDQNNNSRLDRDQRREQTYSVVQVLNKLADALGRIADKL